jgi:hypothetical protein
MARGDHLVSPRAGGAYTHHGLDLGDGRVVHYSGLGDRIGAGPVVVTSRAAFAAGNQVWVTPHPSRRFDAEASVRRALSRVGEAAYAVADNNCEHFVQWCIEGRAVSRQVDRVIPVAGAAKAGVAAGGGVMMVSSAGAVAGLSGPGVISGLAAIGPGGALGGAATLAGGAGLGAAAVLNHTVLADRPELPAGERSARTVGRAASVGGAALTAAAGVASVTTFAVEGAAGGAAIMSGLSGLGVATGAAALAPSAAVGGVAVVVAAPVVASVVLGVGAWKVAQWLFD